MTTSNRDLEFDSKFSLLYDFNTCVKQCINFILLAVNNISSIFENLENRISRLANKAWRLIIVL